MLRSDGRVEKKGGGTDRQTHRQTYAAASYNIDGLWARWQEVLSPVREERLSWESHGLATL